MAKEQISIHNIDPTMIDTVLADDIDFTGKMQFSKSLMIKGKFEGEIDSTGHLIIGSSAVTNAKIKAETITNFGQIKGNVEGTEKVELFSHAHLTGDIRTPELTVESGCIFNGNCAMIEKKEAPAPVETKPEAVSKKK